MRCIAVSRLQNVLWFLNNEKFKIYLKPSNSVHAVEHANTVRFPGFVKTNPKAHSLGGQLCIAFCRNENGKLNIFTELVESHGNFKVIRISPLLQINDVK